MTIKILSKSTLALVLALLTSGLGKTSVQAAQPRPVPSATLQIADQGAPDPCEDGSCMVGVNLS